MVDLGWSELLVIGVVALVVVGPKDLPKMFRTLGQITGRARAMARDFQRAMDSAADEAGVRDVTKTLRETASGKTLRDAVGFDEIDRELRDIGHNRPGSGSAATAAAKPAPVPDPAAPGTGPDADLAARNAAMSHTEAERLKRAERAAAARQQAAEIRARREADAAAPARPEPARDAAPPAAGPPQDPPAGP